ncbi:MAG TPA: class I SAM-dependent methyltransferase [Candidatus Binataceae bacterium]|jgi:SAM-dependent methyltransferase|nr:class I SAM-dependent methyltransferase [Candidatus Binataceae bacterium]
MSFRTFQRRLKRRLGLLAPKYKSFVVHDAENYETMGRSQFDLLRSWGLREDHYLLDIGCGSLNGGRFAIRFLAPGHYFGIEPEQWLLDEGIKHELGPGVFEAKHPHFSNDRGFNLSLFGRQFDFLVAHSILTHTSQAQMRQLFSEAAKVMAPHSIFLATYLEGESDYAGADWVYPGVSFYTYDTMVSLARAHGLDCAVANWPHPGRQIWLVFYSPGNQEFVAARRQALTNSPAHDATPSSSS